MKKIFISILMLTVISFATPSQSRWGENFSNSGHNGKGSYFSPDSDKYWLNKFRNYKKYPINFYSKRMLESTSGEDSKVVEVHDYQRNVAVTARLGQRMYDSTTYTVTTKTGGEQYEAASDGTFYRAQEEVKIKKGQLFTPMGEIKVNGQYYVLFEVPERAYILAADYKGYFLDAMGLIEDGDLYISKDITIVRPSDLHVVPYKKVEETSGDTKLNFEIKYGGIEDNNMVFIMSNNEEEEGVRQYAPIGQNIVQIGIVNFEIIYASPDYIEYKILDSLPDNPL